MEKIACTCVDYIITIIYNSKKWKRKIFAGDEKNCKKKSEVDACL